MAALCCQQRNHEAKGGRDASHRGAPQQTGFVALSKDRAWMADTPGRRHDVSERSQALPKDRLWMGGENTTHVGQEIQHTSSGRMRCVHPILLKKGYWVVDNQCIECR